jgi:hypothetical protein
MKAGILVPGIFLIVAASAAQTPLRMSDHAARMLRAGEDLEYQRQLDEIQRKVDRAWSNQVLRVVEGVTNSTKALKWVWFRGKVVSVTGGGILVNGFYGPKGKPSLQQERTLFFVADYLNAVADGEEVVAVAKETGVYSHGAQTLRKLDYGRPILTSSAIIYPPPFLRPTLTNNTPTPKAAATKKRSQEL